MQVVASKEFAQFTHVLTRFSVVFHRTLRLPEDGKHYPLPPSLGHLPVKQVDDYKDKVPASWREHGGVFIPLHQREALWLGFSGGVCAVKVATGKVNAVNGKPWSQELVAGTEDYMVAPNPQRWLDGFNAGEGVIKQFVAMPMGMGYTVEGQVTGKEEFGGLQILVMPAKPGKFTRPKRMRSRAGGSSSDNSMGFMGGESDDFVDSMQMFSCNSSVGGEEKTGGGILRSRGLAQSAEMGLAAGGSMTQKIYPDSHGVDTWDQENVGRLYVHIVNAEMYEQITGEKCPPMPVAAQQYAGQWFNLGDGPAATLPAPAEFQGVKTVSGKDKEHGFTGQQDDSTVTVGTTVTYAHAVPGAVRDGKW